MWAISRALGSLGRASAKAPSSSAWYSVQVLVPSLGESITDGTIASVLKRAGDSVEENETIAQIETDKVTIDIKAPADGTVLGVVVQEQDTVVPGQLVATLDDAAAQAKLVGGKQAAAAFKPDQSSSKISPEPAAATPAAGHRTPGIRFPPRVTADGRRISLMPAAEATAILEQWQASGAASPAAPSAATGPVTDMPAAAAAAAAVPPPPPRSAAIHVMPSSFSSGHPTTHVAASHAATTEPSKFATSAVRLDKMPARRQLTDKEMELIELGGALQLLRTEAGTNKQVAHTVTAVAAPVQQWLFGMVAEAFDKSAGTRAKLSVWWLVDVWWVVVVLVGSSRLLMCPDQAELT
eukprot:gene12651-biopygen14537